MCGLCVCVCGAVFVGRGCVRVHKGCVCVCVCVSLCLKKLLTLRPLTFTETQRTTYNKPQGRDARRNACHIRCEAGL